MRPISSFTLHSILAAALIAFAASGAAAGPAFLKLGGVEGDSGKKGSSDKPRIAVLEAQGAAGSAGHGGEIHVESFSWGATQTGAHHGGGQGAGKVSVHDISVTKNMDKSTAVRPADGKDGAKGGNVEFEWKVEEGESAPPAPGGVSVAAGDLDGDGRADAAASRDVKSPRDAASGLPTGKRQHKPMMLKAPLDRGSLSVKVPAGTCSVGARYPTAEFGSAGRVYKMADLVVTGCGSPSASASAPMETMSLNYEKIVWK